MADGLTCGIALPIFAGDLLTSVLVIFCGDDEAHAGAIELWRNDPAASKDMTLDDGYYGTTGEAFEFISRRTAFRRGHGLPGMAWDSGPAGVHGRPGQGQPLPARRQRACRWASTAASRCPAAARRPEHYVMAFLSALATPIVRRFEIWLPDAEPRAGCSAATASARARAGCWVRRRPMLERGQGCIGRCFAHRRAGAERRRGQRAGGRRARSAADGLQSPGGAAGAAAAAAWPAGVAWYF